MEKSLRIENLILDVTNEMPPGFKSGIRWFNLGRKHTHMTIVSLYYFGWLINLRTPSMAD